MGCLVRPLPPVPVIYTACISDLCSIHGCCILTPLALAASHADKRSRCATLLCTDGDQSSALHSLLAVGDRTYLAALLKARETHNSAGTLESTATSSVIHDIWPKAHATVLLAASMRLQIERVQMCRGTMWR